MSLFTSPKWDVGKSANALSNEFGKTKEKKKTKRNRKEQANLVQENFHSTQGRQTQRLKSQDKFNKFKGKVNNKHNKKSHLKRIPKIDNMKVNKKHTERSNERDGNFKAFRGEGKITKIRGVNNQKEGLKAKYKMGAGNILNKHDTEDDMDFPPQFLDIISAIEKRLGKRKFSHTGIDETSESKETVKKRKVFKVQDKTKASSQSGKVLENKCKTKNKKKTSKTDTETNVNKTAVSDVQSQAVLLTLPSAKYKYRQPQASLRERMMNHLKSSRFRYLNEQLYTSSGKDAEDYFKTDPEAFHVYHEGYQQQVSQWPLNPVMKIINAIKRKPSNLVIADFGCGDATLARSVPNPVHSFDLVSLYKEVTACDMAHTPLDSSCIDVCVFCLSLMGTDLPDYLIEANRVLKLGGLLKIAEVGSRFHSVDEFIKSIQKYGFNNLHKDLSHNLFYFLDFKKISNIKKTKHLPEISLKPCLYKKR